MNLIQQWPVDESLPNSRGVSQYLDQWSLRLLCLLGRRVRYKASIQQQVVDDLQCSRNEEWQANQRRPREHQPYKHWRNGSADGPSHTRYASRG